MILASQFSVLFLLNGKKDRSYAEIFDSIPNNRRRFNNKLPISKGMLYKRIFELKQAKMIKTENQKIFPSFAIVKLTDQAKSFLQSVPILMQFASIFVNKNEIEIFNPNAKKITLNQTTLLPFIKKDKSLIVDLDNDHRSKT